jgi:hypothetical protein
MVDRINLALAAAFNNTLALLPPPTPAWQPPQVVYEPSTDRFSLLVDTASQPFIAVSFNGALASLLAHFNASFPNVNTCTIIVPANAPTVTRGATTYAMVTQENRSTDVWSPIQALTFATTMPVQTEDSSPTNLLGSVSGASASRNFIQSLTDIGLALTGGAYDWTNEISYSATIYRFSTLLGSAPLKEINFALYWICRYNGVAYPVYFKTGGGGSISLKILLERISGASE